MPKIAEALVERKALQDRLNRVNARLVANAKVQEGDRPSEPPSELLEEGRRILLDIKLLTMQINQTNIQTPLPGTGAETGTGTSTIMEAIAERDRLAAERTMLEHLGNAARFSPGYNSRNEIRWLATVDVADVQKQIDAVSQSYRLLDTRIQEANWFTELIQD
jgi:hypothetical protein